VSRAIVQLGRRPEAWGRAYHLTNRRLVRLRHLLGWVRAHGYPLEVIPPVQWLVRAQGAATPDTRDALGGLMPMLANGVPFLENDAALPQRGPNIDDRNAREQLAGSGVECP